MLESNNEAKQDIIEGLLGNLPKDSSVLVQLPSECRVYPELDDEALIKVNPITFDDEKAISKSDPQDRTDIMIERCVPEVNVGSLLMIDYIFLLLKIREISYGDDYTPTVVCPKCETEVQTKIKLSELNVNPVPDDFGEPVKLTLPTAEIEIEAKYPRVKDRNFAKDLLDNLWRFVSKIDKYTDKSIINGVVKGLPIKDLKIIEKDITPVFGVDTQTRFACPHCQFKSVIALPIDVDFFGVS